MTGGAVDAHKAAVARARSARRVVFDLHACAPGQVVAPLRLRVGGVPAPPVHVDLRVPQAPPAPPRRDSKPAWSWPTGGAIAAIAAALWWRQRSRRHQAATNARATEPRAASAVSTPAQPGPVLRLRLTVVTGVRRGRSCDIDASVTSLGRKAGASDLLADDPAVLPRHCDIAIEPGRCRLVSTPGASLLINGAPSPGGGIVRDGDTATLGHTELRLRTVADRTVPLAALDGLHTEAPPRAAR
jgi:hypothetical protein